MTSSEQTENFLDHEREQEKPLLGSDEEQSDYEEFSGKGTVFSGFINLVNTLLGAGLLGLPYAFAQGGYVVSSVILLLGAIGSGFGLHLLACCSQKLKGPSSFNAVALAALPSVAFLIDLSVAIKCFGVATSYLLVVGTSMPLVVKTLDENASGILIDRKFWITVFMFLIVVPLSFLKSLTALRHTSLLSVITVAYLVLLIVLFKFIPEMGACEGISDCQGTIVPSTGPVSLFSVLSIFVFSYTCHQNVFAVYNENSTPRKKRLISINFTIALSLAFAFVLYLFTGFSGYFTYGSNVHANILENFPSGKWFVVVAQTCIAIMVVLSYPLQCHPARISITKLVHNVVDLVNGFKGEESDSKFSIKENSTPLFFIITILHLVLSYIISMVVTDLGIVFKLIGATGSTTISYILPGICYAKMFYATRNTSTFLFCKFLASILMILVGLFIMIVSLSFIFIKL